MFKRILVPLDGSQLAESALPAAKQMVRDSDGELELLRVATAATQVYSEVPYNYAAIIEHERKECKSYLDVLSAQLNAEGIKTKPLLADGYVAEAILDYADSTKVDLIVMSTHGRSGFKRMLLGSVADKVVHGAKVPVLLIRPIDAK